MSGLRVLKSGGLVVDALLTRAVGPKDLEPNRKAWLDGTKLLKKTGLIVKAADENTYQALHPLFAEYWAARCLASRLADGARQGWFEAELWDHLKQKRLDPVLADALAILSTDGAGHERLREAFKSVELWSLSDAVTLMADVGGEKAAARVHATLESGPDLIRFACAEALGRLRSEKSVKALGAMLDSKDDGLRLAVVQALGKQRSESAIPLLLKGLKDSDFWVAKMAADSLKEHNADWVVQPLIELLGSPGEELKIRAILALREQKCERATRALTGQLKSDNPEVRLAALEAFWEPKEQRSQLVVRQVAALLKDPDCRIVRTAIYALYCMTGEGTARQAIALLDHEAPAARCAAADTLGRLRNGQAVKPLAAALRDPDASVCEEAGKALGKIGTTKAVDALIASLREERQDVRYAAVCGLWKAKGDQVLTALVSLLKVEAHGRQVVGPAKIGRPALADAGARACELAGLKAGRVEPGERRVLPWPAKVRDRVGLGRVASGSLSRATRRGVDGRDDRGPEAQARQGGRDLLDPEGELLVEGLDLRFDCLDEIERALHPGPRQGPVESHARRTDASAGAVQFGRTCP